MQQRLRAQDLLVTVANPSIHDEPLGRHTVEASTATWVDDLAVVVCSATATGLIPKMAKVAAVVEQCLSSTGVQVNYSPGKTVAMFCFRGRGARNARKFWEIEQRGCVRLPSGPGQGKQLQLATSYTHLGSRLQANGQQVEAIDHRMSIARPVFVALRKRLLFNSCLSRVERIRLMAQGPLASLLHGSGLWVTSDAATARRAHEAITGIYRQCVRPILGISSRGLTNQEVCHALGVLEPVDVLRFQRLRAALSVAPLVDEYLIAVLVQERSWLSLVISDWASFPEFKCPIGGSEARITHIQVQSFFEWLRRHAQKLKSRVAALVQVALKALQQYSASVLRKAQLLDGVFAYKAVARRQPLHGTMALPRMACPECHKIVQGHAALAAHRSKTHGIVSLGALLGDHTACPVCLIEYWSPARLWEHMRKSTRCRHVFEASDPVLLPSCKAIGRHSLLPATRIQGPREWWTTLQPSFTDQHAQDVTCDLHTRVTLVWSKFCASFPSEDDIAAKVQHMQELWREVLWAVQTCDGSVDLTDPIFRPTQHELARLLRACEGFSVVFKEFLLVSFGGHRWVVPSQARACLTRLVNLNMHEEFVSLQPP